MPPPKPKTSSKGSSKSSLPAATGKCITPTTAGTSAYILFNFDPKNSAADGVGVLGIERFSRPEGSPRPVRTQDAGSARGDGAILIAARYIAHFLEIEQCLHIVNIPTSQANLIHNKPLIGCDQNVADAVDLVDEVE